MTEAGLHDGSTIAVEVQGRGPTVLLAVNPEPVQGSEAEELRRWGVDPALGRTLLRLLLAGRGRAPAGVRTDRLWGLAVGGYPPLDGPYARMLRVTTATHEMAVADAASPPPPSCPSRVPGSSTTPGARRR